jgi:hypothetical protein
MTRSAALFLLATSPFLTVPLTSCTTSVDTAPPRSASEQLLMSTAAERAADQLRVEIPSGTKLFIDTSNFEGVDAKYAVGTIRDRIARQGAVLVDKKADAQTVLEIRSGALSVEQHQFLIGIPSFNVPMPLAGTLGVPEIALYKHAVRAGVAKFAASEYDKSGTLVASVDPKFGFSEKNQTVLLLVMSWTDSDIGPKGSPVDGGD